MKNKKEEHDSIDSKDLPIVSGRYSDVSLQLDYFEKSKPIDHRGTNLHTDASNLNLTKVFNTAAANKKDRLVDRRKEFQKDFGTARI